MSARRLESSFPLIEFTSSTGSQDRLSGEIRGSRLTLKLDALRARSTEDVRRLRAPEGYLRAGAPRYATLFGRDSLISALQMLDIDPTIAAATLRILASFQGRGEDRESEEQPGKILHEHRFDAASRLELPSWKFPYYGSVDSTPLFLIVGDAYLRKTADSQLARELWGAFRSAHEWMARYGDSDHDGYLEYERTNPSDRLLCGVVQPRRLDRMVSRLFSSDLWTPFGVRTHASTEPDFDPLSYHLGSVWPHDNWFLYRGLLAAGREAEAQRVRDALLIARDALGKIPEFYGVIDDQIIDLSRETRGRPQANPLQAWASAGLLDMISRQPDGDVRP